MKNKEKYKFMIDIETTGVNFEKDQLLEIGIVALTLENGFYRPGGIFHKYQYCDRQPTSEFAKKYQVELYGKCNNAPNVPVEKMRELILEFLGKHNYQGVDTIFVGKAAGFFDMRFLDHHGYLKGPSYKMINGKETQYGDFSHRVDDITTLHNVNSIVFGVKRKDFSSACANIDHTINMDELKNQAGEHNAIYDCMSQLKELNGYMKLMRVPNIFEAIKNFKD